MKTLRNVSSAEVDFKSISARIKKLRQNARYSQEELSEALGYSPSYVYQIEAGLRKLSVTALLRIAVFFDISLDYLITGTEKDVETDAFASLANTFSPAQRESLYHAFYAIMETE